jgi:prepilin-type N-terminal cleavage/methylation domain-containing protein
MRHGTTDRSSLPPGWRRLRFLRSPVGFTLIELMIVILILAILVGLAVMVALYARTKAWASTGQANDRIGNTCMQTLWLNFCGRAAVGTIPTQRYTRYYDGLSIWAQSMSTYETKIKWVDVRRTGTKLFQYGVWKKNVLVPNTRSGTTYYYDWSKVYGNIGVYRGYRNGAAWTDTATTGNGAYGEVTLMVLIQGSDKCYYTCYSMGSVISAGSFTWESGTGNCTAFGAY